MPTVLGAPSPPLPFLSHTSSTAGRPVSPLFTRVALQFKGFDRKVVVVPARCLPPGPSEGAESDRAETTSSSSGSSSLSWNNSTYKWCAGFGGIGLVETAYLTYLKLSNSEAFCPIGGGSCSDILTSDYAAIFGVPLPVLGMIAYGTVATLGLQLAERKVPFGIDTSNGRFVLVGITTTMATASAYFLYILSTKFSGVSCSYCLFSAMLSFSLFFIVLKDFGLEEMQKMVGLQISIAILVFFTLTTAYSSSQSIPSSLAEMDMPFFTTEITKQSSPFAVSLARHLRSIGAKMYGAFWCSHCLEQKEMFGQEAAKLLDYVECFPNGYKKGTKIAKACADVGIEGFPTWVINGQVLSGETELPELAQVSGFDSVEPS